MRRIILTATACMSLASQAEAKTAYQLQLQPSSNQTTNWQNGIQYVDDTKSVSVVRVVAIHDTLPDKQTTFRIFVLNKSSAPVVVGPENVVIEYGDGERLGMVSREELEGRLRRDMKRRQALAVLGAAFSAQGADGYTTGSFNGTTSNGTNYSGTYSGYDPALARQQQGAAQAQWAAVQRALAARQLSGNQALESMMQKSTIAPGGSFGGVIAFDAPSAFKRLAKSGMISIVVTVGGEQHRIAAKVYQTK